jgi:hypothetical protein
MCDFNKIVNSDTITGLGIGLSIAAFARYLNKPMQENINRPDYIGAAILGFSAATNFSERPFYSSLLIGGLIGGLLSRSMNTNDETSADAYADINVGGKLETIPE